uniref:Uncharacterized protein n=1 Tax=Pipistrellus kuhlii TaxID=59472 RepID=A0A7J7UGB7_PIPKU|nr:hypothetical protein mPipKuh1_009117 [Pipistrellus kuhlii]
MRPVPTPGGHPPHTHTLNRSARVTSQPSRRAHSGPSLLLPIGRLGPFLFKLGGQLPAHENLRRLGSGDSRPERTPAGSGWELEDTRSRTDAHNAVISLYGGLVPFSCLRGQQVHCPPSHISLPRAKLSLSEAHSSTLAAPLAAAPLPPQRAPFQRDSDLQLDHTTGALG